MHVSAFDFGAINGSAAHSLGDLDCIAAVVAAANDANNSRRFIVILPDRNRQGVDSVSTFSTY
jgi:hypothetical protein